MANPRSRRSARVCLTCLYGLFAEAITQSFLHLDLFLSLSTLTVCCQTCRVLTKLLPFIHMLACLYSITSQLSIYESIQNHFGFLSRPFFLEFIPISQPAVDLDRLFSSRKRVSETTARCSSFRGRGLLNESIRSQKSFKYPIHYKHSHLIKA